MNFSTYSVSEEVPNNETKIHSTINPHFKFKNG